jgi:hypothetical protein
MLRTTLAYLLLIAMFTALAYAVEPASKPPEDPNATRNERQRDLLDAAQSKTGTSAPFPRQFVMGKVTDLAGTGMGGTKVKLFADGEILESVQTNPSGYYEIELPLNIEKNQTVVLWFVPGTDRFLMQCVVLKKSQVADHNAIFGPCATTANIAAQMSLDVTMMTEDQLIEAIKAKGCY